MANRYRAPESLQSLFKTALFGIDEIHAHDKEECIVLKKIEVKDDKSPATSKSIKYEDTPETVAMRERLRAAATNAMYRGVITALRRISCPDQAILPHRLHAQHNPASGYGDIDDVGKIPHDLVGGVNNYKQFLNASFPRAFAVSATRRNWLAGSRPLVVAVKLQGIQWSMR